MSDNYDPLATQTSAFTFRRLDALQDSVAAFGKTSSGSPAAILVATDGTLQTRRLGRLTDEVVLIGTDTVGTGRPVLVDARGRVSFRPLSAIPLSDFDGARAYFLGPAAAQVQGKADADGSLFVIDAVGRAILTSILGQLDITLSALRDSMTAATAEDHPRHLSNWPADFPDALAGFKLQNILAQIDRPISEIFDVKAEHGAVTAAGNSGGLTVVLDLGPTGRPIVQRFISAGSGATIQVQVSRDAITWRTLEMQTFAVAGASLTTMPGNGYQYVRITSANVGVALEFEISGCR